jgi:hypothetical protein
MVKLAKAVSPVNFKNAIIYNESSKPNPAQMQVTNYHLPKNKQKHIPQNIKNICIVTTLPSVHIKVHLQTSKK